MQDDAIALSLGLPGFRVLRHAETPRGLEISVESTASASACPTCQALAIEPKERPVVRVRDLPFRLRPTWLLWRKRRYRCPGCGRSFTEECAEIPARARATRRYEQHLYGQVATGAPMMLLAREEATTFYRVQAAFVKGSQGRLGPPPAGGAHRSRRRRRRHGGAATPVASSTSFPGRQSPTR